MGRRGVGEGPKRGSRSESDPRQGEAPPDQRGCTKQTLRQHIVARNAGAPASLGRGPGEPGPSPLPLAPTTGRLPARAADRPKSGGASFLPGPFAVPAAGPRRSPRGRRRLRLVRRGPGPRLRAPRGARPTRTGASSRARTTRSIASSARRRRGSSRTGGGRW